MKKKDTEFGHLLLDARALRRSRVAQRRQHGGDDVTSALVAHQELAAEVGGGDV